MEHGAMEGQKKGQGRPGNSSFLPRSLGLLVSIWTTPTLCSHQSENRAVHISSREGTAFCFWQCFSYCLYLNILIIQAQGYTQPSQHCSYLLPLQLSQEIQPELQAERKEAKNPPSGQRSQYLSLVFSGNRTATGQTCAVVLSPASPCIFRLTQGRTVLEKANLGRMEYFSGKWH